MICDESMNETEVITDSTSSFVIMSPSLLQSLWKRYVVWRNCKEDLVTEEGSARHAIGVSWKLKCTNEHCKSEKEKCFIFLIPKKGHFFEINCRFILVFLGLGKSYAAAKMSLNVPAVPNEFRCEMFSILSKAYFV